MHLRNAPRGYQSGGTYGACPVCGFKERLNDMRLRWDGLRVCAKDWETRPETMTPPVVYPEGLIRPDASPELPPVFYAERLMAENGEGLIAEDGGLLYGEGRQQVTPEDL